MIKITTGVTLILLLNSAIFCTAQTNPAITRWLQNTSVTARHYVSGNSTPINDASLVNVQNVKYSANYVYATTTGLPSYVTGPYLDGNPSVATNQNAIFKFPLNPVQNTGTLVATTGGNIGVFINGVAFFDYRDGASWQNSTQTLKGGPYGGTGDGVWNRDAVVGEKGGFDCSKGHPAMGNYHHHQNPSAFKLDLNVISTVCNLYNADGLYSIDLTQHSPLIGFAYDGFPVYGAYGYKNIDGTGCIVRMKSSYAVRNITTRTTYASGATVTAGPVVSTTYPLGYFREDYQYNATSAATPDYLDSHNGRFCVTPEYPNGIYCYFATVDANWNSAYPYLVGPTFYGTYTASKVASITETVTTFPVSTTPSIYIAACSKTICSGTSASFMASVNNGGVSPSYQWKKNGTNVGTNSKSYSTTSLANGDIITCVVTTASSATATSNSISMTVNSLPTVSFTGLAASYCTTIAAITLTGSPSGGTFSGTGISGNTFSPATAGAGGPYTITYTYTNGNGCTNSSTQQVSVTVCATTITLSMKLFLQGYYLSGSTMQPVLNNQAVANSPATQTDNITVELHHPTTYALIDTKQTALNTDGTVYVTFTQPAGSYYIAVKHRNTLQTWTAATVACTTSTPLYNFSTAANKAMGNNQVQVQSGVWAFFTGDLNQDDFIDSNDFPDFDADSYNGVVAVYKATDMNGDGFVDGNDFPVFDMNSYNGVASVHP